MSYDIALTHPLTGEVLLLDEPHHMRGGTVPVGGSREAALNITYNYSVHYKRLGEKGLRSLYGLSGAQSIPLLKTCIGSLGRDVDSDYWNPTEGNARLALLQLYALARCFPDGVWLGD